MNRSARFENTSVVADIKQSDEQMVGGSDVQNNGGGSCSNGDDSVVLVLGYEVACDRVWGVGSTLYNEVVKKKKGDDHQRLNVGNIIADGTEGLGRSALEPGVHIESALPNAARRSAWLIILEGLYKLITRTLARLQPSHLSVLLIPTVNSVHIELNYDLQSGA